MHDKIPDFTETELWVIRQAVAERFRKEVDIQQADAELRLDPGDRELTLCPVVYWRDGKAQFVIFKTGVANLPQPVLLQRARPVRYWP